MSSIYARVAVAALAMAIFFDVSARYSIEGSQQQYMAWFMFLVASAVCGGSLVVAAVVWIFRPEP